MINKLIGLLGQVPLQIGSKEKQELVYNGIFTCLTFLVGGLEYANAKVYNDEIFVKNLNAIVFLFQKEGKIFLEGIYNIIPIIRIMGQGFQQHCERLWNQIFGPLLSMENFGNFEETQASLDLIATLAQYNCLSPDQYRAVLNKTLQTVKDGNVSTENKPGLFITLGILS